MSIIDNACHPHTKSKVLSFTKSKVLSFTKSKVKYISSSELEKRLNCTSKHEVENDITQIKLVKQGNNKRI